MAEIDLTNQTGKRMLSWVAPIYGNSLVMKIIYQAIGMEWESVESMIVDIKAQFSPYTATWSLGWWEDEWSLLRNEGASIEERRKRIIAKIHKSTIVNPARMRAEIKEITGKSSTILHSAPYTFKVRTRYITEEQVAAVRELIEDIKPAHKSFTVEIIINSWYEVKQFSWGEIVNKSWWQVKYDDIGYFNDWGNIKPFSWAEIAQQNWYRVKGEELQ